MVTVRIGAALVTALLFAAPAKACVLLEDVDYSVLYRSDTIIRATVVGYESRPQQRDALFQLKIAEVLNGRNPGVQTIAARWERKYSPAPAVWNGYSNIIVGIRLAHDGQVAEIVRENCGFDGIVEDTPQDLTILRSQAPGS
jgi:hypothetical protein